MGWSSGGRSAPPLAGAPRRLHRAWTSPGQRGGGAGWAEAGHTPSTSSRLHIGSTPAAATGSSSAAPGKHPTLFSGAVCSPRRSCSASGCAMVEAGGESWPSPGRTNGTAAPWRANNQWEPTGRLPALSACSGLLGLPCSLFCSPARFATPRDRHHRAADPSRLPVRPPNTIPFGAQPCRLLDPRTLQPMAEFVSLWDNDDEPPPEEDSPANRCGAPPPPPLPRVRRQDLSIEPPGGSPAGQLLGTVMRPPGRQDATLLPPLQRRMPHDALAPAHSCPPASPRCKPTLQLTSPSTWERTTRSSTT